MAKATRYLGAMGAGFCLPQLFECEDGKRYVVKFMSNPQGIRGLPNELIAYRLGQLLDLPVVPGEVIYIDQGLIDSEPELQKQKVQPGPHYGSLFYEHAKMPSERLISACVNLDQAVGMIVFDHWIQNDDRDTGNVLVVGREQKKFYLIDHESCFCGSGWYEEDLLQHRERVKPYWTDLYERFVPYIDQKENPFHAALKRLESLTHSAICQSMQDVPEEWEVEPEEWDLLIDYLERRQPLVRRAVQKLKQHFPVWSGRKSGVRKSTK